MFTENKRILVVDDEPKIAEVVASYLENSGFSVIRASNGHQALDVCSKAIPSLIILDLMLPDMSGEEVCRILRKKTRIPIIMLTAKVEESSILEGLDIGADDYITKPFSPKQLVARVLAVLRRSDSEIAPLANIMSFFNDDIVINTNESEVRKKGEKVSLTPNEYKLLMTFVKFPKKIFTREELIDIVLGDDFDGYDRIIDTHVKNIRQKIESDPKNPVYIVTAHGLGYRFGGE